MLLGGKVDTRAILSKVSIWLLYKKYLHIHSDQRSHVILEGPRINFNITVSLIAFSLGFKN